MKTLTDLFPSAVLPLGAVALEEKAPEGTTLDNGLNVYACRTGPGNAEVRISDPDSMAFMDDIGLWYFASDAEGQNPIGQSFDNQVDLTYSVGDDPDRPDYSAGVGGTDGELPQLPENGTAYLCINAKRQGAVFNCSLRVRVWREEPAPLPLPDGYAVMGGKVFKLTEIGDAPSTQVHGHGSGESGE